MEFKRVVVTGLGALTPIGNSVPEYWESLINGVSGAALIKSFDTEKFKTKFACEVKNFDADAFLGRKDARKLDPFVQYECSGHGRVILGLYGGILQESLKVLITY